MQLKLKHGITRERIETYNAYCIADCALADFIKMFQSKHDESIALGYENLYLDYRSEWDDPGEYVLYGDRPENEGERIRRLENARDKRESRKRREERDRELEIEELARLKEKYEKGLKT